MSPPIFLIFLISLTVVAAIAQLKAVRLRRKRLRRLAGQYQMHYAPADRLKLAERIAGKLPMLGAADVRVMDLIFRTEGHRHRYLFTVEFGVGVIRGKRRRHRVAGFDEPVHRSSHPPVPYELTLTLAPESLRLIDAYTYVLKKLVPSQSLPPVV
ncbi:MAG: hypothetical protein ABSF29_13330 [Tepidisphaeraceae bacterium]|jgi:hypothetical protein